jgi:hypothetical protein
MDDEVALEVNTTPDTSAGSTLADQEKVATTMEDDTAAGTSSDSTKSSTR